MTDMMKIAVFGIVGVFLAIVLKEQKPYFALCVSLLTAVGIFLLMIPKLSEVISYAKQLYSSAGGKGGPFDALIKVTGISILSKISSDICKDAGQQAAASILTMAGRVLCMFLCLPQVGAIFKLLTDMIPTW